MHDAEYCTFKRIVQREGGDAEAFESAKNWCIGAIDAWENNQTFHGHPYTKYCIWRKANLLLHIREKISHSFKDTKSMSISESGSIKRKMLSETPPAEPETPPAKKAKGAATVPGGDDPKKPRGSPTPGEKTLNKAALLSSLKSMHDKSVQGAKDLQATIEKEEEWGWCRGSPLMKPLESALEGIVIIKESSEIWKAWTLHSNFQAYCQKNFDAKDVEATYDRDFAKMKEFIKLAESTTSRLKKMQLANV